MIIPISHDVGIALREGDKSLSPVILPQVSNIVLRPAADRGRPSLELGRLAARPQGCQVLRK
jgi:hypothetical protein